MKLMGMILMLVDIIGDFYHPSRLPVAFVIFCTSGLIIGYALSAFLQNDVSPIFPRISHTGNFPPASMVFSFNLGIAAILLVLICFVTFKAMKKVINYQHQTSLSNYTSKNFGSESYDVLMKKNDVKTKERHSVNRLCLFCGLLSSVGALGVGAFQVTHSKMLHYVFLVLMVFAGYSYSFLHTISSKKILMKMKYPKQDFLFKFRIAALTLGGLGLVIMFSLTAVGRLNWKPSVNCTEEEENQWQYLKNCSGRNHRWKPGDGGFTYFAISNVGQWIWLASFFVFVFTIRNELLYKIPPMLQQQKDEGPSDSMDASSTNLQQM